MTESGAPGKKAVVVFFQDTFHTLACGHLMTMAEVGAQWQRASNLPVSVAFFCGGRLLADHVTVGEALPNAAARSLELTAVARRRFWVQVYGFEETNTLFEVVPSLTPAAVRRDLATAAGIHIDDFRLTSGGVEVDQELAFSAQGLTEGDQLVVDLRTIVKIHSDEKNETTTIHCFGSDSVGDLRQKMNCGDEVAFVSTSPYRRLLEDSLCVCHIVTELLQMQVPILLHIERKMMLTFEPTNLEHLRQKLPVFLSLTPLDVYDLVTERFQLKTDHRLAVNGQPLNNREPLVDQLQDIGDVIQVDILRPILVSDLWENPLNVNSLEEVFLYSTESSHALYLLDELSNQRIYCNDINMIMFGTVADVLGPINGQEKRIVLVDRDVERSCPTLTFDGVVRKLAWAKDMLLDIVPAAEGLLPNEIMHSSHLLAAKSTFGNLLLTENTLTITNPEKVFISSNKKLSMFRFGQGATYGDVRAQMQQLKGCLDVGLRTREWHIPEEAMNRKLDRELLFLTSEARLQTRVMVTMNDQWFGCWFQPQQVRFSDIMKCVGKQAGVMPRHLFRKNLFCCGCGRRLSKEEEPHQAIPATCCSVRSLQLTDRRTKDAGLQTAGSRRQDAQTCTLDTESRGADTAPMQSLNIVVISPDGGEREKEMTLESSNCRILLEAADRHFDLGDSTVIYSKEVAYEREDEERNAVCCFDEKTEEGVSFIDLQDGTVVDDDAWLCASFRFLRPSSPMPTSPSRLPVVVIRTEVEILTVTARRQLQAAPTNALTDSSFVALLRGVRSGGQIFWELTSSTNYVNSETAETCEIEEIPGGPKRFVIALLRDNDPVIHLSVPKDEVLLVLKRAGLELRLEEGRVRCAGPPQPADIELWELREDYVDFLDEFGAAAAK